jgi:hypothetical protein
MTRWMGEHAVPFGKSSRLHRFVSDDGRFRVFVLRPRW